MASSVSAIEKQARKLSAQERERLAERLLAQIEGEGLTAVDEAWVSEAERRFSAWKRKKESARSCRNQPTLIGQLASLSQCGVSSTRSRKQRGMQKTKGYDPFVSRVQLCEAASSLKAWHHGLLFNVGLRVNIARGSRTYVRHQARHSPVLSESTLSQSVERMCVIPTSHGRGTPCCCSPALPTHTLLGVGPPLRA
jgi:hypothetical protein